jgi:GTP-binding protein LepA
MDKIRNFSIIAHIDHGKSTLSDRFLEITGLKDPKDLERSRVLDRLDLEQEKGITIKLQAVRMDYKGYTLNLIDTPGHVDFSYEVSRSLKACEGAILLVDATQGVQAQTISNLRHALDMGLEIIPVLNKIDVEGINIKERIKEFSNITGFQEDEIILASGKTGEGADEILQRIIDVIPAPKGDNRKPLQALIFDSFYDEHKGVITAVRIFNGQLSSNNQQKLTLLRNGGGFSPKEIGYFKPDYTPTKNLYSGEVGYIATGLKDIKLFTVGDTISDKVKSEPLKGYKSPKPMVFATLFPVEPDQYREFADAINKLSMNDAALTVSPQKSNILGSGFKCGFLGMLHMEIIQERLDREYSVPIIVTSPSVEYKANLTNGEKTIIQTAGDFPDPSAIAAIKEPWVNVEIFTPEEYIGPLMELCQNSRGKYATTEYIRGNTNFSMNYIIIKYQIPLMSLITNFFDRMKSLSHGYASLDYSKAGYKKSDIVKISILVNKDEIPALSFLSHRSQAESRSRKVLETLKETIPKHQFRISLQSAIGGKIIAREDISAMRKDVTAKLYGGDVTRKRKLLEKQKKGKKKLREIGGVNIPQKAFLAVVQS